MYGRNIKMKKKYSLINIVTILVFMGIFFLPFNSFEGFDFLGEFSKDSCTIFFLLASIFLFLRAFLLGRLRVPIKNPLFHLLLIFYFWLIVSTLLNVPNISSYYFKQTSGFSRTIRQYLALFFSGIIFLLTYYNAFNNFNIKRLFFKVRRVIFYSFIVVSIYSIIEILILKFKVFSLEPVINLFNYFPFTDVHLDFRNYRISSVTFETPALATYLFFVAGWMFSYVVTGEGFKKYIPGLLTIVLALFSGSRAGLLIIFIQAIAFGYFLLKKKKHQILFIRILKYSFLAVVLVFLVKGKTITNYIYENATSFKIEDDVHAISNKSRFGIQYALFQVFLQNPIYGVGFGQQAFVSKNLYPPWATKDNWEFRLIYLNEDVKNFPPGYNIYLRILAESGFIGLLLFLTLLSAMLFVAHKVSANNEGPHSLMAIVVFVSILGVIFNWLKMDTFRIFNFWINLALLFYLTKSGIKVYKDDKKNQ